MNLNDLAQRLLASIKLMGVETVELLLPLPKKVTSAYTNSLASLLCSCVKSKLEKLVDREFEAELKFIRPTFQQHAYIDRLRHILRSKMCGNPLIQQTYTTKHEASLYINKLIEATSARRADVMEKDKETPVKKPRKSRYTKREETKKETIEVGNY